MTGNQGGKGCVGTQTLPRNHGHRARSGIVSEKSFLSYYKTEFLRAIQGGVQQQTGNGMREKAHCKREGDRTGNREAKKACAPWGRA
jgi:hypothetical protein